MRISAQTLTFMSRQMPGLLDLDPNVIAAADKSTLRGGTEFVTYTNSVSNAVYYIGVKSEDQQAAEFGFIGLATDRPFGSLDANGQLEINFTPVCRSSFRMVIRSAEPSASDYQSVLLFRRVPAADRTASRNQPVDHARIPWATCTALIEHNGKTSSFEQSPCSDIQTGATNFVFTYDDLDEGDVTIAKGYPGHIGTRYTQTVNFSPDWMHTDGPGSLKDFVDRRQFGCLVLHYDRQRVSTNRSGEHGAWLDRSKSRDKRVASGPHDCWQWLVL